MIKKNILDLTSVESSAFPNPTYGFALINKYKPDNLSADGYKIDSNDVYVSICINDVDRSIAEASFTGWVNSTDTSLLFSVLFSSNGLDWSDPIYINNDGTKRMSTYVIPSDEIPAESQYIRIYRPLSKTAYIGSIELQTDPAYYEYKGLDSLTINGDLIDGFDSMAVTYSVTLPLVENNLSIAAYPVEEDVILSTPHIVHKDDNVYVVQFYALAPNRQRFNYEITIVDSRQQWRPNQHKGHISISQFRVSADDAYLDMIFSCPEDYYFTSLLLEVRHPQDSSMQSQWFDLSPALFVIDESESSTISQKRFVVRLPLKQIGVDTNSIFLATLKAHYLYTLRDGFGIPAPYIDAKYIPKKYGYGITSGYYVYNSETQEFVLDAAGSMIPCAIFGECEAIDSEITDTMLCSNVNNVYRCMLNELMATKSACDPVSDELIRKYIILYGHQAALTVRDLETAESFYKLMQNCFHSCPGDMKVNPSCGCH